MAFNQLSDAQLERLYILSEELGEAQQAVGKILRHGYDSKHPETGITNKESFEHELGDVKAAIFLLTQKYEVSPSKIVTKMFLKLEKFRLGTYLHHQHED
jgi:NTP pyrophosphatase (non-canonical NTP hydrolase)